MDEYKNLHIVLNESIYKKIISLSESQGEDINETVQRLLASVLPPTLMQSQEAKPPVDSKSDDSQQQNPESSDE